jgi:hypothetical protein
LYGGHPETDQWFGNFSQATCWKAWRQDWTTSNAHIKATKVTPFIYAVVSLGMNYICSFRVLMSGTSCSYYPLYPPASGVPLDFSLANEALEISSTPDVLLLPSDLAPFVKVITSL